MSEDKTSTQGSTPTYSKATKGHDGRWRTAKGKPLPVSASDLERFTYCPVSWHLAATGTTGKSSAIDRGIQKHQAIHESMMDLKGHQFQAKRNLLILEWWYAIILVLLIDTLALSLIHI